MTNQRQIEKCKDGVLHPNVGISTTVHFHRIQSHSEGGDWGGGGIPPLNLHSCFYVPAGRAAPGPARPVFLLVKVKANCIREEVLGSLALLYCNSTISLEGERDN